MSLAVLLLSAAATDPLMCETGIVGAGWAGVYAAWRLIVDTKVAKPEDVCLFEARPKAGGRTYSVGLGDGLVVDVGAYRFGKQQHLPGDLILNKLQLPTVCYQPDCAPDPEFNETLYRVVDAQGRNAGYFTPIQLMLDDLSAAGARIYYDHELTGVYAGGVGGASSLHFAGGQLVSAGAVLLNMPRLALRRLDPASIVFPPDTTSLSWQLLKNCTPCLDPIGHPSAPDPSTYLAVKVYALYDDPWWLTKLNLVEGSFRSTERSPPLVGRYHDGPVRNSPDGTPIGPGALEAVYSYSVMDPSIRFYEPFAASPAEEPLTLTTDPALLLPLHEHLMDFHADAFAKVGITNATAQVPPPKQLVLGVWTSDPLAALPQPFSNRMHSMIDTCPLEPCLEGVASTAYNAAVASPNPAANIHIANNDFALTGDQGVPCCWAEQTLKSVERTLHTVWQLPAPSWLDAEYYATLLEA